MILKPYSIRMLGGYRRFLNQNYFICLGDGSLQKVNLKGINKISKSNDPEFNEIKRYNIIARKFDVFDINPNVIRENEKADILEISKSRLHILKDGDIEPHTFESLGALFSMEMTDIIFLNEVIKGDLAHPLEIIKDSMIFSEKGDTFVKFADSLEDYRRYFENPSQFAFLEKIITSVNEVISEYDCNPFAHFMLGLTYHRPTRLFDLKKSVREFKRARECSWEIENQYLTAMSDFFIAWLYYVNDNIDGAIDKSLEAIDNEFIRIPEIYYNLSKYYAVKRDPKNSIKYLDEAIRRFDSFYAIKSAVDEDFDKIRKELNKYFSDLKSEEKNNLIRKLKDLGINFAAQSGNKKN